VFFFFFANYWFFQVLFLSMKYEAYTESYVIEKEVQSK